MRKHIAINNSECKINNVKEVSKLNYGNATIFVNDFVR